MMFLPDITMLLKGKKFPPFTSYVEKHAELNAIAGSAS